MKPPVEYAKHEDLLVFRLSGELTSYILDNLKRDVAAKVKQTGIYRVLVNLEEVEYVTSKDLGVFVQIFHFLDKERESEKIDAATILAFSNLKPFVQDVMEMTRLETIFRIFESEREALDALIENREPSSDSSP